VSSHVLSLVVGVPTGLEEPEDVGSEVDHLGEWRQDPELEGPCAINDRLVLVVHVWYAVV
jgi:hypothetical protein